MGFHFSSFIFLVGILTWTPFLIIKADSDTGSSIPFNEPSPLLENFIDSRFKKLSVGFQVQIDELKLTVTQLQASKSEGTETHNNDGHVRQLHKRQTSSSSRGRAVCESSSSLCTFYHPDHPDVGRTRATYNNGIVVTKSEVKEDLIKFNGMPTNCKDLQLLGHKLNGFYSVKVSQPKNTGTKIETVFCDFQSTDLINGKGMETKIGAVDIKSSSVHFSVSIKNEYGNKDEKIKFQNEVLNIGGGYDWENQWFRVPYPGIYYFALSGSKNSPPPFPKIINKLDIGFIVNGQEIGEVLSSENTLYGSVAYQFSMKLNASDKVELIMYNGKVFALYFTGWMVEEELNI